MENFKDWLASEGALSKDKEEYKFDCGLTLTTDELTHRVFDCNSVDKFVANIKAGLQAYSSGLTTAEENYLKDFYSRAKTPMF